MKKILLIFICALLGQATIAQKLVIETNKKTGKPTMLNKGKFNVMLINDTNKPIHIFHSHHKEYGGAVVTWDTFHEGKRIGGGNKYKPMDTNSRYDKRAFATIQPGAKKHMATLALEPKEPGNYKLSYNWSQDPATANLAFAKDATAKSMVQNITLFDISASVDCVVEAIEVKAFEAREISYEDLQKEKNHKDFKDATYDPSSIYKMNLTIKNAKTAAEQFEQLAKLRNLRSLGLSISTSEEIVIPESVGDIPLMILSISGRDINLKLPANFLKTSSLINVNIGNVASGSLDFIGQHVGLQKLYLSSKSMTEIPSWISNLTELEELSIGQSKIREIPPEFAALKKLKTLHLSRNELTSIDHIFNNSELKMLYLNENKITALPEEIGQLQLLEKFSINKNKLTTVPSAIGKLTKLKDLDLSKNEIKKLPAEFGNLTSLTKLFLDDNNMTKLPTAITKATSIEDLYIRNNKLTSMPASISKMKKLVHFNFENNQIEEFPESLFEMKRLYRIFTKGNPIKKKQKKKLAKSFGRRVKS